LLKRGRYFKVPPLPCRQGDSGPYANALDLALADDTLVYCEGYKVVIDPVPSAWCCTREGQVVDPSGDGVAYFGIPFKLQYVCTTFMRLSRKAGVLDNDEEGWPLLSGVDEIEEVIEKI
jgi:hypothetical protein